MKFIKTIGIVLLAIIVLALIAGAFLPTHYEYERSTEIKASREFIFNKINDLRSWEEWGPWKQQDSTMQFSFGDQTVGTGASYSWTSKHSGEGTMTVTEVQAPEVQKARLEFKGEGGGDNWFKLSDADNGQTKVTWGFGFDIPYPFNAMTLLPGGPSEKDMYDMFDLGLSTLKDICEKEAGALVRGYQINREDFPGATYLTIRTTMSFEGDNISKFFEKSYGTIMGAMGGAQVQMQGYPTGIYYEWNEETATADMAAAIPVPAGTPALSPDLTVTEVPAGKCLVIDYYGPYEGSEQAHFAMDDYIKANNLVYRGPVLEVYITDPSTEPDTAKWLTRIYYMVSDQMAAQ